MALSSNSRLAWTWVALSAIPNIPLWSVFEFWAAIIRFSAFVRVLMILNGLFTCSTKAAVEASALAVPL